MYIDAGKKATFMNEKNINNIESFKMNIFYLLTLLSNLLFLHS